MPCWCPGQGGRPPSSCGGRQCSTPGLSHPVCPVQLGGPAPGGVVPISAEGSCLWAFPKKPVPEADGSGGLGPPAALHPCHLWAPTPQPPLPAQPYPFQVELSWGGGSRGARRGREGAGGDEREKRSKKGQHWGEEQGIQLATENPVDRKRQFHTRSALERDQTRFGSDAQGGSGDFRDKALMNRTRHVAFK